MSAKHAAVCHVPDAAAACRAPAFGSSGRPPGTDPGYGEEDGDIARNLHGCRKSDPGAAFFDLRYFFVTASQFECTYAFISESGLALVRAINRAAPQVRSL